MPRIYGTLYEIIKKYLEKHPDEYYTAQDLFSVPDIRFECESANRVSDYLGNLWRRGFLTRVASDKLNQFNARWMYRWKGKPGRTKASSITDVETRSKMVVMRRPEVIISEEGDHITVETSTLIFIIKTKK